MSSRFHYFRFSSYGNARCICSFAVRPAKSGRTGDKQIPRTGPACVRSYVDNGRQQATDQFGPAEISSARSGGIICTCRMAAALGASNMAPTPRMRPDNVAGRRRHRIVVHFAGHVGRARMHERMCPRHPRPTAFPRTSARPEPSGRHSWCGKRPTLHRMHQEKIAIAHAQREAHWHFPLHYQPRFPWGYPLQGAPAFWSEARDAAIACLPAGGRSPAPRGAETIPAAIACAPRLEGGRNATVARVLRGGRDAAIACLLAGGRSPARLEAETIPAAVACAPLLEGGRNATVARVLKGGREAAIACFLGGGHSPARRGPETIPAAVACACVPEGGRKATVACLSGGCRHAAVGRRLRRDAGGARNGLGTSESARRHKHQEDANHS